MRITLYNDLGELQTPRGNQVNGFFEFNSTNLHLHGLHIGSEEPEDDVAVRVSGYFVLYHIITSSQIPPGFYYEYEYNLGEHCSGAHVYHAHCHGAVMMQVGGGAFGLIIIEDEASNSPLRFLKVLPSIILSIWQFSPGALTGIADTNDVFQQISGPAASKIILVNGFLEPMIRMNPKQWFGHAWLVVNGRI
jgi:FtsP/CotA-like multicopper oxidase with cupredoxin domain